MAFRKARVLIVEDDLRVLRSTGELLAAWGLIVEEARDGLEALEKARSFDPEVILSDLRMPGMGGMEFLQELRPKVNSIHFIIISGAPGLGDFVKARQLGACACLEKPVTGEQLRLVLNQCIDNSHPD